MHDIKKIAGKIAARPVRYKKPGTTPVFWERYWDWLSDAEEELMTILALHDSSSEEQRFMGNSARRILELVSKAAAEMETAFKR